MVLVTSVAESSEVDDWTLCWEINLQFHKKVSRNLTCMLCGKEQPGGTYYSSFVRDTTRCRQNHTWANWTEEGHCICNLCDMEMVLNITLRRRKCFVEGCESLLNVDREVVSNEIEDEKLLEKYIPS
jgi:hypothetical protein